MEAVLVNNFGKEEAYDLIKVLQKEGIFAFAKESGYGSFSRVKYGSNSEDRYTIVLTNHEDSPKAHQILVEFRKQWMIKKQAMEMVCPKCGQSEPIVMYRKLNLLQRIIYAGTKPKKCASCKQEWI
jgi:hypothetical protein